MCGLKRSRFPNSSDPDSSLSSCVAFEDPPLQVLPLGGRALGDSVMWNQKEWFLSTWEKCLNDSTHSLGRQPQAFGGGTCSLWRSVILFRLPVIFLLLLPLHLCNYWPTKQFTSFLSFDAQSGTVAWYKLDRWCYLHFTDRKLRLRAVWGCLSEITQLVRSQVPG